jgi:two-component system, LytTR family, response regulator
MRTIVIDDEPKNIRILKKMLTDFCQEVTLVGDAENARQGIEIILKEKPDLVFLDIEMPYGNAFDMLDKLKPVDFEIIFVTAFDNYTLKAFKYSALDYLLKPVSIEELVAAVKKAAQRHKQVHSLIASQVSNFLQTMQKSDSNLHKIALPSKEGLVFIKLADIIRCEASAGYTSIHLKGAEKIISSRNIREYEDLLPDASFFRAHNAHLINLNFVKKYHKGRGGYIEMEDGALIEVASRRKDELLLRFGMRS